MIYVKRLLWIVFYLPILVVATCAFAMGGASASYNTLRLLHQEWNYDILQFRSQYDSGCNTQFLSKYKTKINDYGTM